MAKLKIQKEKNNLSPSLNLVGIFKRPEHIFKILTWNFIQHNKTNISYGKSVQIYKKKVLKKSSYRKTRQWYKNNNVKKLERKKSHTESDQEWEKNIRFLSSSNLSRFPNTTAAIEKQHV